MALATKWERLQILGTFAGTIAGNFQNNTHFCLFNWSIFV